MRAVARATAVLCALPTAFWGALSGTPNSLSASEAVCLMAPPDFQAGGPHHRDFSQMADEAVIALLKT